MKSKRFVALMIDVFIITFLCELIRISFEIMEVRLISSLSLVLAFVLLLCKDCCNGMSIGRRITKIQVFDSKTMKVASPVKCVIRNCVLLIVYPIELLVMFCGSSGLRVGDYIAHTRVLDRNVNLNTINMYKVILTVSVVVLIFLILYIILYVNAYKLGFFRLLFIP